MSLLLRDRLLAELAAMGASPDYGRLAADVLGIRNAPPELARRLVSQALVVEDRQDGWQRLGDRLCETAPATPGVYVLRDGAGRALYVGKATNLRRRLRTHFSTRRWRGLKAEFVRAADAEWHEVGSELEALLREAMLIAELRPAANIQTGPPAIATRRVPAGLVRDVVVLVPSVEPDSVELVSARVEGGVFLQRTRKNGADLAVHARRVARFFFSIVPGARAGLPPLAPIVFSWLAGRGQSATRLDPHDAGSPRELRARLEALVGDRRLFTERLVLR